MRLKAVPSTGGKRKERPLWTTVKNNIIYWALIALHPSFPFSFYFNDLLIFTLDGGSLG